MAALARLRHIIFMAQRQLESTIMYYTLFSSPMGDIALTANEHGLTGLAFQQGNAAINIHRYQYKPEIFQQTITQINEYFLGQRKEFTIKLAPQGTTFQQQVWQELSLIPFGETVTYSWLAQKLNNPKAVRAVGSANGKNPIALIIPCHRVIGTNKNLTGYAGGLSLKAALLSHEGASFVQ